MLEFHPLMYCPTCGAKASATAKFCSSCGQAMDSDTGATLMDHGGGFEGETIAPPSSTPRKPPLTPAPSRSPRSSPTPNPLTSSDAIGGGRFTPGQILAERYRIVALAGRGGMGEVFRAEDLTLGQIVAMKFLPERLSQDEAALSRFHAEVRNARQVSHPNVCRVFDIGESDGSLFLTMEYVDGEDLASVVRRIGRLSPDKATEIARQICAGLAAAHERGVIHRDLKPANVMLDGAGKIRITDFGLAGIAATIKGAEVRAGTPAYMAPEQLAGRDVSARSDIYSLGLILYEILTGKRAFEASTLPELIKLREQGTITNPSTLVRDLDPLIERVILRCLELDPEKRPSTALQVAAALPGGDPLAAALAAGETPSPEMVAAAQKQGALRPAVASALLGSVLVLLAIVCVLSRGTMLQRQVPLEKSPEVLRERATEIVKKFGYTAAPADSIYGIGTDERYLAYIHDTDQSAARWQRLSNARPTAFYFWYRQSPRPFDVSNGGDVDENTPARDAPGMIAITLDTLGRLRSFAAVPPASNASAQTTRPDWSLLLQEAGLDQATLQPVSPLWTPPGAATTRAAWSGSYADQSGLKFHVEAAAFGDRVTYFQIFHVWDQPHDESLNVGPHRERALVVLLLGVFVTVMIGSALLALRTLNLGRGDRKGAFRLAAFVFAVFFFRWLFGAHHVSSELEALNFIAGVQRMLFWAFFFWVVYLAFEPFVRRRWPGRIISWSRVLAGGFRDPLVGRDILIGALFGLGALVSYLYLSRLMLQWLGHPPPVPWFDPTATRLLGVRSFAFGFPQQI